MAILVAGGAGYIGSHTCVELLNAGYEVVVVDNLYNSSEEALKRVEQITGKTVKFYEADVLDREALEKIFDAEDIDSVINFAGLKAVGESVQKPLEYYHNNITGTLILCDVMRNHGVKNIIFSSSATVYGDPAPYSSVLQTLVLSQFPEKKELRSNQDLKKIRFPYRDPWQVRLSLPFCILMEFWKHCSLVHRQDQDPACHKYLQQPEMLRRSLDCLTML